MKLDKALSKLEELSYRVQKLAGTAQCIVELQGRPTTSTEDAIEHFAYELTQHGRKMSELVEIAQRCAKDHKPASEAA